jgi:hypothetical protein
MVSIEGTGTMQQLQELMTATNTKLVFSFDENIHVLSTDKHSTRSVLDMVTFFNQHRIIAAAEPNWISFFHSDPFNRGAVTPQSAKQLKRLPV